MLYAASIRQHIKHIYRVKSDQSLFTPNFLFLTIVAVLTAKLFVPRLTVETILISVPINGLEHSLLQYGSSMGQVWVWMGFFALEIEIAP